MGISLYLIALFIGLRLAPMVRAYEPLFFRFTWLLSISLLIFGVFKGTNSSWSQWLVGTIQLWIVSGVTCELRLLMLRRAKLASRRSSQLGPR
jgi:Na+-driven multidrug efflux pump